MGFGVAAAPVWADGDVKRGKKVFNKCKACHKLEAGKKAVGPSLHGMFGRKAGTAPNFKFSDDLVAAGEKGLVWNDETFLAYMAKPKEYIGSFIGKKKAKTRMAFNGLKKESDRANLLAYLKEASK
jgi:cytochrome c